MPFGGYAVAHIFGFEPEIAAGIILIGSVPGGVASNVMTYLARGDVPLSVTMTSCSTLMSPVMTPLMMKLLAGRLVPINIMEMMLSIFDMIIVPIIAGLVANKILYGRSRRVTSAYLLAAIFSVTCASALIVAILPAGILGPVAALRNGFVIGLALIGVVAVVKLGVQVFLKASGNWMDRALPIVSMVGICFIIAIITARSSEKLLSVGILLIAAAAIQNAVGYLLGYWLARALRLSETAARTVSIEVGMQNGGMASALAMTVLNSANAALAPAIFGPWMNISGSVLANWWHRKPVRDGSSPQPQKEV
jgi:BASS family bile acid:Na+ symporter